MKISFMTFACPGWNLMQILDAAERYGYHGVELRCDANHAHGVEVSALKAERKEISRMLSDGGTEPCCLATGLQFSGERVIEDAPPRIDLAADIGCKALRVFCGPLDDGVTIDEAADRIAGRLRVAAELADQAGMQLWLETNDTVSLAVHAAAIVRQVDHPALGINYDNMHPFRMGESVDATFAAMGELVRHCHFHDALNSPDKVVVTPMGQGQMPVDEMFLRLVKLGYNGYLSGEWFNDQYGPWPEEALERYSRDIVMLADRHNIRIRAR